MIFFIFILPERTIIITKRSKQVFLRIYIDLGTVFSEMSYLKSFKALISSTAFSLSPSVNDSAPLSVPIPLTLLRLLTLFARFSSPSAF